MTVQPIRRFLYISLIAVLCSTIFRVSNVYALNTDANTVDQAFLDTFVKQVRNGQAGQLRGLYVPELLAAPVIQQPADMDGFVSSWQNVVTQFNLASKVGSTGLLAHNDLAGKSFALLHKGQELYLIYGTGKVSKFVVSEILQYQALESTSDLGSYIDLHNNDILTTPELFTRIYNRPGQVILQTCINANGNPTWGRLFVIAEPLSIGE